MKHYSWSRMKGIGVFLHECTYSFLFRYGTITRKLKDIVEPERLVEIRECADMAKYIQQMVRDNPNLLSSA